MLRTVKRAGTATSTMPANGELGSSSLVFAKLVSAFREFVAPSYRPELHYMRGPRASLHSAGYHGRSEARSAETRRETFSRS
jgi:hypothetical protein